MKQALCFMLFSFLCLQAEEKAAIGKWSEMKFTESPQQSDGEQVKLRLSAAETPPAYDVKNEVFDVLVPAGYDKTKPHGLFIWITAGDKPGLPPAWEKVFADTKIIVIAAHNSGNKRNIFDRMRMAIDANHNMRALYNIDGRRVYVSGFSGGSRVASNLGVCYAEMFSGALCFMGTNFYLPVKGEDNKVYGESYLPADELLPIAKKACRYALVTGTKDFNLANTKAVFAAMKKEEFSGAELFMVPEQGHALPSGEWLEKALKHLDAGKVSP